MEIVDLLVGFGWLLVVFCVSAVGGFVGRLFVDRHKVIELEGQTSSLKERLAALENSIKGSHSRAVAVERNERLQGAIAEGMALFQSGKAPAEIFKEIGGKYPDLLPVLLKEVGKL